MRLSSTKKSARCCSIPSRGIDKKQKNSAVTETAENLRKQTAAELSYSRYKNELLARELEIVDYRTSCDARRACGFTPAFPKRIYPQHFIFYRLTAFAYSAHAAMILVLLTRLKIRSRKEVITN